LTSRVNEVGAGLICEIFAGHERHFRNPQARPLSRYTRAASSESAGRILDRWFLQMRTRLGGRVLPIDEPVAEAWALLGISNPLPLIDGLLAATAKVHGLTFVTRNVADIAATGVPLLDPFSGV
jgi:predicted nucleic acid-binding protein